MNYGRIGDDSIFRTDSHKSYVLSLTMSVKKRGKYK